MSDADTRSRLLAPLSGRNAPEMNPDDSDQTVRLRSFKMFRSRGSDMRDQSSDGDETITQDTKEKANKALEKVDHLEQQQNLTFINVQRLVAEHEKIAATKRKINLILYPWVLFAVAINLFLWISMLYGISEASYYGQEKHRYFLYAWLIFLIPVIITAFFIFTPRPLVIKEGREKLTNNVASWLFVLVMWSPSMTMIVSMLIVQAPTSKNLINIANAVVCFVAAASYLFLSAIPSYNTVDWTMTVDYLNELPIPAFVLLIDQPSVNFANKEPLASAWMYDGNDWVSYKADGIYQFNSSDYNDIKVLVFNSTALPSPSITLPTWQYLYYQTNVTYNSSARDFTVPGEPQIWAAAFDSRLSVIETLDCGIQPWYLLNSYSISSLSVSVMHITDTLRTVMAPSGSPEYCSGVFPDKLALTHPKFAIYEMTTSASSPSTTSYADDCDVVTNSSASCPLVLKLNYANQFVLDRKTSHGISELDIWLNIGAIVGAIQFVAWFLLQAVGG